MSINRATIEGHLGKDPEIHTSKDGRQFSTFRIASSERWKDKATGEDKEATEWHSIVVFSDWLTKNVVAGKLKKGSRVLVEGKLETRKYTGTDGVERYTTEIIVRGGAQALLPVDWPKTGNSAPAPEDRRAGGGGNSTSSTGRAPDLDDDIPF